MRFVGSFFMIFVTVPVFAAQYFTDVTDSAGVSITGLGQAAVFADIFPPFDQVHHDLLVLSDYGSSKYLYSNDGDGTFTPENSSGITSSGRGYYTGDYNNDGYLDLFCANDSNARLYENNSDGTFSDVTGTSGLSGGGVKTILLDFDNDGWLDIFFVGYTCKLFRNDGDETFSDVTSATGLSGATADWSAVAFDYDNDGYQDLYLLNDPACQLWHNDNGAGFTEVASSMGCGNNGSDPSGVDVGDYNNDGWFDIYIANISEWPYPDQNRLYRNDGGTGFTDVTSSAGVADIGDGRATWFLDYNNDGLTDLFCTNHVNANAMYHNNGDETFTDVAGSINITNPWDSFGVSWCDYDYDGDLDAYMAGHFDNSLMRNDDCPGNYMVFELEGTDSNRAAIGAKVKVTAGGFDRFDAVIGGSGLNGQDSLPLEFGLGTETVADTVQIRWPSGLVEEYYDLDANEHYYVTEGDGIEVGTDDGTDTPPRPTPFVLLPAAPNPTEGYISFSFIIPVASDVTIDIFDIKGRKTATVLEDRFIAGRHTVSAHLPLPGGIYFYRLTAGENTAVKKLIVK